MTASQTLPELVHAAQSTAQAARKRLAEMSANAEGQADDMASEVAAIEAAAVDIFTLFEARMQRHFKRGPLSRKVKAALLAAGEPDLADRLHQYYLAINVLKHGAGASHRELLNNTSTMLVVKQAADVEGTPSGLIDVTPPEFFAGLTQTILDAFEFLENR
ncbi:MAG: hypothetical protein ACSHWZ_17535 [Sulfitobacter sp.]